MAFSFFSNGEVIYLLLFIFICPDRKSEVERIAATFLARYAYFAFLKGDEAFRYCQAQSQARNSLLVFRRASAVVRVELTIVA